MLLVLAMSLITRRVFYAPRDRQPLDYFGVGAVTIILCLIVGIH